VQSWKVGRFVDEEEKKVDGSNTAKVAFIRVEGLKVKVD
jgi:hypothetical protein